MNVPSRLASIACVAVLACVADAATASLVMTAPRATRPAQVDGRLTPAEWAAAAASTGFSRLGVGALPRVQPTFYAMFDAQALYAAVRVPCPRGAKPVAKATRRDGAVWQDDSVEVFVAPRPGGSEYFHFVVNSAGVQRDARGQDVTWNAAWQAAARCTEGAWVAELAVPWRAVGLKTAPKEIGFNVTWNCRTGRRGHYTWAPVEKSFHEPGRFGRLMLRRDGSALRITDLIRPGDGKLRFAAAVVGPPTPFHVDLRHSDRTVKDQTKTLGRGEFQLGLPMDGTFVRGGEYVLRYRCGNAAAGQWRFTVQPAIQLEVTQRMLAGFVDVNADLSAMGSRADRATLRLALKGDDKEQGKPLVELRPGKTRRTSHTIDMRSRGEGSYRLLATARSPDGQALATAEAPVRKPPKPEWFGCKEGITDKVFAPWTPVEAAGSRVRVWGREYGFSAGPLPTRIHTRDRDVLAGPVQLVARVADREQLWAAKPARMVERRPDHATLEGAAESQGLRVTGATRVEYDGMMRIDLRVEPKRPGQPVSLALEVPIKPEHAKYLYHYPGRWRSAFNVGAVPKDGWTGPFKPYVWLGDNWRGFAWFCESDQHWRPADAQKAVQIVREPGRTVLRLDVLSNHALAKPIDYTFGLHATPVKPLKPDVWDYRIVHSGNYGIEKGTQRPSGSIAWPAGGLVSPARGTFECWVQPAFDPNVKIDNPAGRAIHNQHLFMLEFGEHRQVCLYWNIDDRGMRAFVKTGSRRYPVLLATHSDWRAGEWHHVALTWGDEIAVHVDGRKLGARKFDGLLREGLAQADIKLGFAPCEFAVDEMRLSNVVRDFTAWRQRPQADAATLLLERFDDAFEPDGRRRTRAARIAPAAGVTGGMPSERCVFVSGKFGRALSLFTPGPPRSALDNAAAAGVRTICFHEHWTPVQCYHVPWKPEGLHSLVKACHERRMQLLLYWGYLLSDSHPDWSAYSHECLKHPRGGRYHRKPDQQAYIVCYKSAWQDYVAWSIAKVMDEYDVDGVYLDGTAHPWACANELHGCGYAGTGGKRYHTYGIFAAREMMRRIYAIVKARKPNGQINVHNSTMMVIPSLAWATSTWDGEQFGGIDRGPQFEELLPLDAFRAEFMGQQWGVPAEFLCYNRPYTQREALAFTLLHDVLVRSAADCPKLWRAMDAFGRPQATWLPYWENRDDVQTRPTAVKASLYTRGELGLMAVVSNLSNATVDARVTLALSRLGLAGRALQATDVLAGAPMELDADALALELGPMQWRLIHVEPR